MSEIKISKEVSEIKEKIKSLNIGQVSELIDGLKEDYNIQETAIVQSATAAPENEKSEEKGGNVSLKLVGIKEGSNKVLIYKEIMSIIKEQKGETINLIQAKNLVEKEDKIILENISRAKVEDVKKQLAEKGAESLLMQTKKQLEELSGQDHQEKKGLVQKLTSKIKSLEQEREKDNLVVSFHCEQDQEIDFCHLPKMNPQGNFIINGHNKVVVFQSVRAPAKKPLTIELKFLNSGLVVDLLDVLKTFAVSPELLKELFDEESLDIDGYQEAKELESGVSLPQFLFTNSKGNSYFNIGKLGRKKCNQKMSIIEQLKGQTLAEDLCDSDGKVLLKKNAILEEKNLQTLQNVLQKNKIAGVVVPHSTNDLYIIKIKSPQNKEKTISVVGIGDNLPEEKTYFDLADLICSVSGYINLHQGLGNAEKEEDEDKLENQIVRRVGDLVYNIFDNKLGGFLQDIDNKYLAYISQLKKVDLLKIPNLKDFDNLIKHFFNTSALARLQNQNNALSIISDGLVSSVMGLGGRNSANATLAARNISYSFGGRYDPVETPEGQRIGLVHRLTIGARVNDYGQIIVPYFPVCNGIITPSLVYLTSEEEKDKYIAHFNIKVDEKNQIVEETVLAIHQESFVRVPKEKLDFIYSSFYHLNSVTSATIPFFQHNDATRMLMAANMQRQAVTLLKSQEPLVASGIEASLLNNSPLVVKAEEKGVVEYVDSRQIVIKEKNKEKKTYELEQLVVSNKNVLNFSLPLVKKGDKVESGQMLACGNYANNNELSLGYNLRVAYLCWNGYNYEDAIILSERLVKEDILTSFFVKKHTIIRHNTKYGPEVFTSSFPYSEKKQFPQLDKNGIVKIGSRVKGNDILVGKLTPEPSPRREAEEELLLMSILGEKAQRFVNSSLRLPAEESGTVYQVKRKKLTKNKNELELVEVYVAQKRKIEIGDKLTTRFGNKGVVAKIVPEADMPFDEEGQTIDIIFNPLGIPTRMNIGQLLETILASAAQKLDTKLLCRPFNSPSPQAIKEIIQEAGIKNYGAQKLFNGQTGSPFQQDVYNGYIYTIKLNHMVADKFHARNVGPYSLIYQQPVKGRSQG
ncbi:5021_t:CDS:2, partial [Ambispora gerdemannii]